jgi:ABC-type branched-subunit amino acid transport system substrate-binding protein
MLDDIGANTQQAIKPFLLANGVPSIGPASSDPATSDALTYMVGATADTDGAYQMTYAINHLAGGKPVGVLYENDAVGDPYLAAYQQAAAQAAWPMTAQPFPAGTTDFTAEVTALQAAGVKVVLIAASASALLPAMTNANSIGFTPDWVVTGYDTTASLLASLPAAQEKNMFFSTSVPLFGTAVTQPLQTALTKFEPKVSMGIDPEIGWTVASIFVAAFKKMTADHKPATRKALVAALNSFKNYSNNLIKDVSYAPGKGITLPHVDRPEEAMIAVQNGNLATVSPFSQPPRLQGTGTQ